MYPEAPVRASEDDQTEGWKAMSEFCGKRFWVSGLVGFDSKMTRVMHSCSKDVGGERKGL